MAFTHQNLDAWIPKMTGLGKGSSTLYVAILDIWISTSTLGVNHYAEGKHPSGPL